MALSKRSNISIAGVASQVSKLFESENDLFGGFQAFLPPDFNITTDLEEVCPSIMLLECALLADCKILELGCEGMAGLVGFKRRSKV